MPDPLGLVRTILLALPEVTERTSHGESAWFYRDRRQVATFADRHHDDRVAVWCASTAEARDALVAQDPERFFVPPYVGVRGRLGIRLDRGPVEDLADLLAEAHRIVAAKRR